MVFESILNLRKSGKDEKSKPVFLTDLNINQIINRIEQIFGEQIGLYYNYFPLDEECEAYRRNVYADICNSGIVDALQRFNEINKRRAALSAKATHIHITDQLAAIKQGEVYLYCRAYRGLLNNLLQADIESTGLCLLRDYLKEYISSEAFISMEKAAEELQGIIDNSSITLIYENGKLTVTDEEVNGEYNAKLNELFVSTGKPFKTPFSQNDEFMSLETEIINIYRKKNLELFKKLALFYNLYNDFSDKKLDYFSEEIKFYLSFYLFEKEMEKNGFSFVIPSAGNELSAEGLYDLALACKNINEKKPVVDNSFNLKPAEKFFVLTGPNQGGKTTFARSLGQLVFFSKIGLKVPAKSAVVPYFCNILTHFSVEESIETGRGKLKEELIRLSPMMNGTSQGAFVVINELFTTAANYDAVIMGTKVLEHFINNKCKGIYVTHLFELATCTEGVAGLSAMLDENMVQSYKIERNIVGVKGCAANQVKKYRLSYSDLKERLS